MSRFGNFIYAALLVAGAIGCEKSKLQEEVMGDSTWETSSGIEDIHVKETPPKTDDAWERENAPMEGEEQPKPQSGLEEGYRGVTAGEIQRAQLLPVLDDGLGRFLQNVRTDPAFHKGAFVGFRIVSFFPDDPVFASLDLRPGDTVTRVNGQSIERPEQAAAVWESLRSASNLVVHYRRGDVERALRFRIVDES